MALSQFIYTSTCTAAMTPQRAYETSSQSVGICEQIGITGRVFANRQQALVIMEGVSATVEHYYRSVSQDPLVETILLHVNRIVTAREFHDYSVWLNLGTHFTFGGHVHRLTPGTARLALPEAPSPHLRIMIEAYLDEDMLAA